MAPSRLPFAEALGPSARLPCILAPVVACLMIAPLRGAVDLVAIGDSMTAEYTDLDGFQDYGDVTVPGWQSRSWYQVLALTRSGTIGVGGYSSNWDLVRSGGYEYNWATPGATAADVRYRWSSTSFENLLTFYGPYNNALEDHLENDAEAATILLGANDFNNAYGTIANGGSPSSLIAQVVADIQWIINRVQSAKSSLPIVLVSVPDVGATPDVRAAFPDPVKRARVTTAIETVNSNLQVIAAAEGIAYADIYSLTRDIGLGQILYFGAVDLINAGDPDNNPRYLFCRDGFHPNTSAQTKIANIIIGALNSRYGFGVPFIRNSEALALLDIDPDQPYFDWLAAFGVSKTGMLADPDADGSKNLIEYALLGGDPARPGGNAPLVAARTTAQGGSQLSLTYYPDVAHARHVRITAESSRDLIAWDTAVDLSPNADGSWTASVNADPAPVFLRLRIEIIAPDDI